MYGVEGGGECMEGRGGECMGGRGGEGMGGRGVKVFYPA